MKHFYAMLSCAALLSAAGTEVKAQAVDNGVYYFYDETSKVFLSRGANWGTETTVDRYGIPVNTTQDNGAYNLKPADWNGDRYINGSDKVYTDQGKFAWTITPSGSGYVLSSNGKYLTYAIGPLGQYATMTDNQAQATVWTLMSASTRNAIVADYTAENYTHVIAAAGLSGVTAGSFTTTLASYNATKTSTIEPTTYTWTKISNRSDANNTIPREVYEGTGKFTHTLTGLAEGIYKVSIPAFYRNGSNAWCVGLNANYPINSNAYIEANSEQTRIKGWAEERVDDGNPNSVDQARAAFGGGKYLNEVYCYVGSDGKLDLTVVYPNYQGEGWAIFGTTTVTYYASGKKELWKGALAAAKAALSDNLYANITGEEKAKLQQTIADYTETPANFDTAIDALKKATDDFKAVVADYNAFAEAGKLSPELSKLPYASQEKLTAMTGAVNHEPTSAADAKTATTLVQTALRAAYESNALAEGVEGAQVVYTYDFSGKQKDNLNIGEWKASQGGGSLGVLSSQSWTDSKGKADYGYFDYYNGSANNQHATHAVTLEPGKYMLTVKSRAQDNQNTHLKAADVDVELNEIGNQGGVFGRGWNDYSIEFTTDGGEVTLEWYCTKVNNQNVAGWAGFGDVRLVKLAAATQQLDVTAAGLATYCGEKDLRLAEDAEIAAYKAKIDGNVVRFTRIYDIAAGEGVLLRSLNGANTAATTMAQVVSGLTANADNSFVGAVNSVGVTPDASTHYYVLSNQNGITNFYQLTAPTSLRAHSAYLAVSTSAAKAGLTFLFDGETTDIQSVEGTANASDVRYNMAGQKVGKDYKGLVISNGRKYIAK